MADTKISALTELAATPATDDEFAVVDTSAGSTKRISAANLVSLQDARTATLTSKTINDASNTLTINSANSTVTIDSATATLTVDLSEATVTGTTAEFNTALSDGSFATLAGTETLTGKTIGASTLDGTMSAADNIIDRPKLQDVSETVNIIGSLGGGAVNIDYTSGNVVTATVDTSATTITFTNPPASGSAGSITLILTNAGSQTLAFTGADWAGGTAPTWTASGVDVVTFITTDGGTTWYGFAAGLAMA